MDNKTNRGNEIKRTIASFGTGMMIGNAIFGVCDQVINDGDCRVPTLVVGAAACLLTVVPWVLVKRSSKKEEVDDFDYDEEDDYQDEDDFDNVVESDIEDKPKVKTK